MLKGPGIRFAVMATDLAQVYVEELEQRQLTRRIQVALADSQDSQSQPGIGLGPEGAEALQEVAEEIVTEILSSRAEIAFEHAGYNVSKLTTPIYGERL